MYLYVLYIYLVTEFLLCNTIVKELEIYLKTKKLYSFDGVITHGEGVNDSSFASSKIRLSIDFMVRV